jgi:hypothetical protein
LPTSPHPWNLNGTTAKPGALWYFSDVFPGSPSRPPIDDAGYPALRQSEARRLREAFMDGAALRRVLPNAFTPAGLFDDTQLVRHPPGAPARDAQHISVNIGPTARYTQAPHGTTRRRLWPWGSGVRHLFLAGDWTRNGLNVGCVEAAVMSGRLAANAINGGGDAWPPLRAILGYEARYGG